MSFESQHKRGDADRQAASDRSRYSASAPNGRTSREHVRGRACFLAHLDTLSLVFSIRDSPS